jgi:hypothetical protein
MVMYIIVPNLVYPCVTINVVIYQNLKDIELSTTGISR